MKSEQKNNVTNENVLLHSTTGNIIAFYIMSDFTANISTQHFAQCERALELVDSFLCVQFLPYPNHLQAHQLVFCVLYHLFATTSTPPGNTYHIKYWRCSHTVLPNNIDNSVTSI